MVALPVGTVTFLFTDVENSTPLWDQVPDAIREAMIRHDALIEAVATQHQGVIVRPRGEGDSRFIVFSHATDAVNAAAVIQRAFAAETWTTPFPLRVRIGLHTGEIEVRADDYYGTTVNRAARIRSLAVGGQTLLSQTTAQLVREHLPDYLHLHDLGEHLLKGLVRPERIFQLNVDELPTTFPPLKSINAPLHNLPAALTHFVGRERELREVKSLIAADRLVTLTGSGGVGKTRLALETAANLLDEYPDGVWLVELASVTDTARVVDAVADVLGVREMPNRSLLQSVRDYIGRKTLLLLLDNCEHVIAAAADLVSALLQACPNLKIVATSREALGVSGERAWRVPSLRCPGRDVVRIDEVGQYEAVRLFLDRAASALPDFSLTERNTPAVVQICQRLDGIPLAIELATTRIRGLTVEQIAQRLDDRFRLLTGGSRNVLPRQQTLRTMIDWSYDLLSAPEKSLLRQLAVFVGGWSLEAAESVCSIEGDVLDLLLQLVNKSLVVAEERQGETRYRLLETIRQYSREKLFDAGEVTAVRDRHLHFYVHWMQSADPHLRGHTSKLWMARVEFELDNLRAALEWAVGSTQFDTGQQLVAALYFFWNTGGYWSEGITWGEALLAQGEARATVARLRMNVLLITFYGRQGNMPGLVTRLEEANKLSEQLNDPWSRAMLAMGDGMSVMRNLELFEQGLDAWQKAYDLYCEAGETWWMAWIDVMRGDLFRARGDLDTAEARYLDGLRLFRVLGEEGGIGLAVGNLGRIAFERGNYADARLKVEEALAISREGSVRIGIADWLIQLGLVAFAQGDYPITRMSLSENLILCRDIGYVSELAFNLVISAGYGIVVGRDAEAVRLLGAADNIADPFVRSIEPLFSSRFAEYRAALEMRMDAGAFAANFRVGQSLSVEDAVELALNEVLNR